MKEEKGMLKLGGLKCDNPKCFYRDEDIKIDEYKLWFNKPCPQCGEILLTLEDMKTVHLLAGSISIANKLDKDNE